VKKVYESVTKEERDSLLRDAVQASEESQKKAYGFLDEACRIKEHQWDRVKKGLEKCRCKSTLDLKNLL
jgi:hypothetical protein